MSMNKLGRRAVLVLSEVQYDACKKNSRNSLTGRERKRKRERENQEESSHEEIMLHARIYFWDSSLNFDCDSFFHSFFRSFHFWFSDSERHFRRCSSGARERLPQHWTDRSMQTSQHSKKTAFVCLTCMNKQFKTTQKETDKQNNEKTVFVVELVELVPLRRFVVVQMVFAAYVP